MTTPPDRPKRSADRIMETHAPQEVIVHDINEIANAINRLLSRFTTAEIARSAQVDDLEHARNAIRVLNQICDQGSVRYTRDSSGEWKQDR